LSYVGRFEVELQAEKEKKMQKCCSGRNIYWKTFEPNSLPLHMSVRSNRYDSNKLVDPDKFFAWPQVKSFSRQLQLGFIKPHNLYHDLKLSQKYGSLGRGAEQVRCWN
jgi:hypothetical protein